MKTVIQNNFKSGVLNIRICDSFVGSTRMIKRKYKMKAIIDAVNSLNGDLELANQGDSGYPYLLVDIHNGSYWLSGMGKSAIESSKNYSYICTVDEFNSSVDELSAATWIDGVSLEEWKAGMKNTVIDSHGNELEIGKVYEFSDNRTSWNLYVLEGCNNVAYDNDYEYEANNCSWRFMRECQSPLGTIKKAQVKLVDGKAYQFESVATGRIWVGFYNSTNDRFDESIGGDGSNCFIGDVSDFKNIIPLAPEIK